MKQTNLQWNSGGFDAGGKPYPNESSITLCHVRGPDGRTWPSDIAAYYDKIDDERGIERAKLSK